MIIIVKLNINTSIHDLVKTHPEIKEIMKSLGFDSIMNPIMINTVGKVMNLKKGAKMKNIDLSVIIDKFREHNFELEDNNE